MKHSGVTLLETLVAIFVMGIGLIALFTLFPIGILRMAAAIQADRAAQSARIAENLANITWTDTTQTMIWQLRNDPFVLADPTAPLGNPVDLFINPWPGVFKDADPDGPSFPVFIDPPGYRMGGGLQAQFWLASAVGTVPRRTTSFAGADPLLTTRWFTLLDDMPFETTPGLAAPNAIATPRVENPTEVDPTKRIFRYDGQYSWAYLAQRPRTSDKSLVNLSVVVFKNRALGLNSGLALEEDFYQDGNAGVTVAFAANTVNIAVSGTKSLPNLRTGDWILDATYIENAGRTRGTMNGFFYQIVGVKEIVAGAQNEYEVQPPLRNLAAANGANATRRIIILDGVVEVFDKGPGRLP